jgi:hypothetical protein
MTPAGRRFAELIRFVVAPGTTETPFWLTESDFSHFSTTGSSYLISHIADEIFDGMSDWKSFSSEGK